MAASQKTAVVVSRHGEQVTYQNYITGFIGSLLLTLAAFFLVQTHVHHPNSGLSIHVIMGIIAVLALTQFTLQARYFLHVGAETKPRVKMLAFYFMMLVVLIVVFGSIWIMQNLNYHMQMPSNINTYMNDRDDL